MKKDLGINKKHIDKILKRKEYSFLDIHEALTLALVRSNIIFGQQPLLDTFISHFISKLKVKK